MDKRKERMLDCIVGTLTLGVMTAVMYLLFGGWITFFYAVGLTIICVWVIFEIRTACAEEIKQDQNRLQEEVTVKSKAEQLHNTQIKSEIENTKQESNKTIDRI